MNHSPHLDDIMDNLAAFPSQHCPDSALYRLLKRAARREVEQLFHEDDPVGCQFASFGNLRFPFFRMGAIDSLNLFDFDELILFSYYWQNRGRYRRVADLGANIGLHSILLSRCGFEVKAFEPDPVHFERLEKNLALNGCSSVYPVQAAISCQVGQMEFVRVKGNTTGSHLAGAKANPYGDLERFPVRVELLSPLLKWADLIKMDIEGHEAEVLLSTTPEQWQSTDAVLEINNQANAQKVFEHFHRSVVHLFSQKTGWRLVHEFSEMPTSHHDGSLFLSFKDSMDWGHPMVRFHPIADGQNDCACDQAASERRAG